MAVNRAQPDTGGMPLRRSSLRRLLVALTAALATTLAAVGGPAKASLLAPDPPARVIVQLWNGNDLVTRTLVATLGGQITEELPVVAGFAATVPSSKVVTLLNAAGEEWSTHMQGNANLQYDVSFSETAPTPLHNQPPILADGAAKMDDVKAKIDKRTQELDAKGAAFEADGAEADAADALDFAAWAVDNAQLALLDAIDARAFADDLAKAASS